jgi:hypothetical protein
MQIQHPALDHPIHRAHTKLSAKQEIWQVVRPHLTQFAHHLEQLHRAEIGRIFLADAAGVAEGVSDRRVCFETSGSEVGVQGIRPRGTRAGGRCAGCGRVLAAASYCGSL